MSKAKPYWLKVKIPHGNRSAQTKRALRGIHTVCKSAVCPNRSECFSRGTATFLILGNTCTRYCGFCAVNGGTPKEIDKTEPKKVAEAVKKLNLTYVIITSVTRDDLADGGAEIFCVTIEEVRAVVPTCTIEVLVPDFKGSYSALKKIAQAKPTVIGHNIETVKRLYPLMRKKADYNRSLTLIHRIKNMSKTIQTKSGIMIGVGENKAEIVTLMKDLRTVGCDILTIGQYLQPTKKNLPVERYVHPDEFRELQAIGKNMGFSHVESGPLVRSSYHADKAIMRRS